MSVGAPIKSRGAASGDQPIVGPGGRFTALGVVLYGDVRHVGPVGVALAGVTLLLVIAVTALSAEGEGFCIRASHGAVAIPSEARSPSLALRLADDRMYMHKGGRGGSASQQTHGVLLELLREQQPELHDRIREVGRLSVLVGRKLAMNEEQLDELRRAAELKDIGKTAVPEAILSKPGPLDGDEWMFLRRHTLVGERILAAAPALTPVAALVRASHERWDGAGYPDGLSGLAIPLGARIVAVCDAFDAMVAERPYSPRITPEDAFAELHRQAGTQFDPDVVAAFEVAWHDEHDDRFDPAAVPQPAG